MHQPVKVGRANFFIDLGGCSPVIHSYYGLISQVIRQDKKDIGPGSGIVIFSLVGLAGKKSQ